MLKIKVLPANCGDSIIVSYGDKSNIKNILIDGGTGAVYKKTLKAELDKIREAGQFLDLVVVTHSHEDHAYGIIRLMEDSKNSKIVKKVWFNSGLDYGREEGLPMLEQTTDLNISYRSVKTLESKLESMGVDVWNKNKPIKSGHIEELHGATLRVLSPDEEILEKFEVFIAKKKDEKEKKEASKVSSKKNDYSIALADFDLENFKEDSRVENGTSIAFMFEYASKKILFLADAFPSIVTKSLKDIYLKEDEKPIKVDYVKLSHHGARGNLNDELLSSLECSNFIVSTSGCNNRPSKETFARILKRNSKNINLYFNYKNEKIESIFSKNELDRSEIELLYLPDVHYEIGVIDEFK